MEQRYFEVFDNRDYQTANFFPIKTAFLTVLFNDLMLRTVLQIILGTPP
ncbi:hypothetical protein [Candidatus Parabeggiatoa sp. HSG14]|nr:hypothetical protein [Thiotrichales bacterium HSG14]